MTPTTVTQERREQAADQNAIRQFRVNVTDADLADLKRRLAATRWPDKETVADQSQGVQLAKLQELVRYWGTEDDWRNAETKLNAFPQFKTNIDGIGIHFIHVRSCHTNALPMPGRGRLRRRDSVPAGLRLLGAADRGGLGD